MRTLVSYWWNKGAFFKLFKIKKTARMACAGAELYNKIETFVFFDLETTDLIKGSKMPKITELSMVASHRNAIKPDTRNKLALPRVLHKLTIPICPRQPINPQASFASNLWNDTLEHVKPFDERTYNMIMEFIERLPGVICFVAHNGNRFDYPVFLAELDVLKKSFPDRILCVDSLLAFQEFYSDLQSAVQEPVQMIPIGRDEVDEEELQITKSKGLANSLNDHWNDSLCSVLDEFEKVQTNETANRKPTRLSCENGKDVIDAITNSNKTDSNSTGATPKSSPKSLQEINEKTPENQIIRTNCTFRVVNRKILNGARKKLNFSDSKPKNFKLSTVYLHMVGCEPENLHCAEGDCISMLRCVSQMGPHFAEWADNNAVSLNLFRKGMNATR